MARFLLVLGRRCIGRSVEAGRKISKRSLKFSLLLFGQAMTLDLEQFLFPKHIWSCVLVTLKLLSKFLNLYREIIDDASVIVCTAAVCCCELGRCKLMVVIIWFVF